ncbi:MAG: ATP-binding cassette domain-containing protein [Bacillota bacterium]|nr:ATP-binding cassette domain-containing protein [Bacillota bacterium]
MKEACEMAIVARDLVKVYRIAQRRPGVIGGLRTLFSPKYHDVRAVQGINFDIPAGQFVGYVGPNGAGKSTTVKMLAGILHPTSGTITVNGLSPQSQRQRLAWQIGVVFGQRTQLWWDLPTVDSFELLAAMYEVPRNDYLDFMKTFSDLLGIDEFLNTPVRQLSLGQRMRADLAAALIHRPRVLFLDEPTIGLDIVAKSRIREFLLQVNESRGATILLTTHDLRDIEELCKRVMVINHGKLVYDGSLSSLRDSAGLPTVLSVKYESLPRDLQEGSLISANGDSARDNRDTGWTVESIDRSTGTVRVAFDRSRSPAPSVIWAMRSFGEIMDVSLTEPLIEEIIKRLLKSE